MSRVITVPGTTRGSGSPRGKTAVRKAVRSATGLRVEACSEAEGRVFHAGYHPFIAAVDAAYRQHLPLALSPDHVWLLVAQGFARIVQADPEAMRASFVSHAGTVALEVRRDEFVPGSRHNDWPGVFAEFSQAIRSHIGDENHGNLVVEFSTTGPTERAASAIVLMDAMQSYFTYSLMTLCGIPEVRLEGSPADWTRLAASTRRLGERYGCGWWTEHLTPFLDRVAACAGGADDPELWRSIYKLDDSSGGPFATGWITQCFPYLQSSQDGSLKRNDYLGRPDRGSHEYGGVTTDAWPGALSRAPFLWTILTQVHRMTFAAGFTHFTQDRRDRSVRPAIGWAVAAGRVSGGKGGGKGKP